MRSIAISPGTVYTIPPGTCVGASGYGAPVGQSNRLHGPIPPGRYRSYGGAFHTPAGQVCLVPEWLPGGQPTTPHWWVRESAVREYQEDDEMCVGQERSEAVPDGVCFWTPQRGYWLGTFQDGSGESGRIACVVVAESFCDGELPADGVVKAVRLVEVVE